MIGRYLKIFLPIITVLFLFVFGAFVNEKSAFASENPGSIKVCKIIVDENGEIVDGSQVSGATFSIEGLTPPFNSGEGPGGVLPKTNFTTPLTLNADLIGNDGVNDASCVEYKSLAVGDYFYSQETITGSGSWADPKYNDQFDTTVSSISDFFSYDNRLFDSDSSNDGARNTNADGHIVLQEERPSRTLIVLNKVKTSPPAVGGGPNVGGASAPSCPANGPQKVDQVWFSGVKPGSATVQWANKGDAAGFHIQYGPSADNLPWGTEVSGSANFVTLSNLPSGDLWVAITAKQSSGCGGPTTSPVKVSEGVGGGEVLGATTLAKTGVLENLMILLAGLGALSLGLWQTQKALQAKSK